MRITSSIRSMLFAVVLLALSAAAFGQIGIAISFAPPEMPVYEQPLCPGDGYLWTPGYWAYANDFDDYYWVPGTWVMAPEVGYLWTPAYWGWGGNGYFFYEGYWGPQVGFYGGINYGYGYFGDGFQGGRWQGSQFYYNRSASNVNITNIHNVYNTTVINTTVNRVSYNGGNGGINRRPTPQEEAVVHERHIPAIAAQTQHLQAARAMPDLRASVNHGAPPIAATPKPGALNDRGVVRARPTVTPYNRPVDRAATQSVNTPARPQTNEGRPVRPTLNNPQNQTVRSKLNCREGSPTIDRTRRCQTVSQRFSRLISPNRTGPSTRLGRRQLPRTNRCSHSTLFPHQRMHSVLRMNNSAHNPRHGRRTRRSIRLTRPRRKSGPNSSSGNDSRQNCNPKAA